MLLACYFLDCVSWILSAVLRHILIQLLPFWNWTPLYNTKCLIERNNQMAFVTSSATSNAMHSEENGAENCLLCETMENIPTVSNVTFSYLQSEYLYAGLPVIVTDSHGPTYVEDFIENIWQHAADILYTEPCDISTNLMLKQHFNMELALQKLNATERAFIQFRNCQFAAVKLSRLLIERPYYYPKHFEPYYSSWFILSHNFMLKEVGIYVKGLILVQQWQSFMDIALKPRDYCTDNCPIIKVRLMAGEGLLFTTDLWSLSYALSSKNNTLTTILEIDWQN